MKNNLSNKKDIELKDVVKAVYKSVLKTLRDKKRKEEAQEITEDILDSNDVAEVDPDNISPSKEKVLHKKDNKGAKSQEKGVRKLKKYMKKRCRKDEPIPGLSQK